MDYKVEKTVSDNNYPAIVVTLTKYGHELNLTLATRDEVARDKLYNTLNTDAGRAAFLDEKSELVRFFAEGIEAFGGDEVSA